MSLLIKKIMEKIKDLDTDVKNLDTQGDIGSNTDFNSLIKTARYRYGGTNNPNKPPNWGIVEVINLQPYILQRCTGSTSIAIRTSWNNGAEWSSWKTYS